MKKVTLVLVFLLALIPVFSLSLGATLDVGSVQDFLFKTNSYQYSADIRAALTDKFEVRVPATFCVTRGTKLIDSGVFLVYHPWPDYGLFMGLSLIQFAYIRGNENLEKSLYGLNEITLGWTFKFFKGLIVEPSISIHDPSGTFEDEYSLLKGQFPCYRKYRIKLSAGWSFDIM